MSDVLPEERHTRRPVAPLVGVVLLVITLVLIAVLSRCGDEPKRATPPVTQTQPPKATEAPEPITSSVIPSTPTAVASEPPRTLAPTKSAAPSVPAPPTAQLPDTRLQFAPGKGWAYIYSVKKDDNLSAIGWRYGTPVKDIYEWAKGTIGPNPNLIFRGQELVVKLVPL